MFIYIIAFLVVICFLLYFRASLLVWTGLGALTLITEYFFCPSIGFSFYLVSAIFVAVMSILNILPLRRLLLTNRIFSIYKKILPKLSSTEKEALEAGTVWWDGELFSGKPNWEKLLSYEIKELTEEEKKFLAGPATELCSMLDDFQITEDLKDMPLSVWNFIKKERFLGMVIPTEYGGLGFSARAHSEVVQMLATRSATAAVTVMVPNSLGPAELLRKYGTTEQKDYYLPRLATGTEVPCFALTSPQAGSDASSMPDSGVVCRGMYNGEEVLGINLNWEKRYITLGPVATLLGLAFKLFDPDNLLDGNENKKILGITLALIPTDLEGIEIGDRHYPLNSGFHVGPNYGKDVFIPLDKIIGGVDYAGKGWQMLMDCLAEGRSISLPALSTGFSKLCALTVGAYARIRKQFNMPIGKFEGVEAKLAEIAVNTYISDSVRELTAGAVDSGEKPSVISAIAKYHLTEMARVTVNNSMDVIGGAGICLGPRNLIGKVYEAIPIGITVEGANILTRSMIIFGQGAIRCHPFVLNEMMAVAEDDNVKFDKAIIAHIGFAASNKVRTAAMALTCARFVCAGKAKVSPEVKPYIRQLTRLSSTLAYMADISMFLLGGSLKRREALSARLGDVLSEMYLASSVIKKYESNSEKREKEEKYLMEYALKRSLYNAQEAFMGVFDNFPVIFGGFIGCILKFYTFPYGRVFKAPSDKDAHLAASVILTPSELRDSLTEGTYIPASDEEPVGLLELALLKVIKAEEVEAKINKAVKDKLIAKGKNSVKDALDKKIITENDVKIIDEANSAREEVIKVDSFKQSQGLFSK